MLVKAICSHIRNLGLQSGNKQRDQVQIVCFSALLPMLVKCGKYTTDKDVEGTHLIASHHSLKHLLKVEHKVSINDYPIILYTVYTQLFCVSVHFHGVHNNHAKPEGRAILAYYSSPLVIMKAFTSQALKESTNLLPRHD